MRGRLVTSLGVVWAEVCRLSPQNLTLLKKKITHFATLCKTRDLNLWPWAQLFEGRLAKCWLVEMTSVMTSLPFAHVFQCLFRFALVPLRADWRKSYSSVDGESRGNCRWILISRVIVASSPSFSRPVARASRRDLARRLRWPGHKSEYWFLVCLRFPLASKQLENIPLLGIPKGRRSWGARVELWWERSPPTKVARVQLPASKPYVGWVCCWFSPLNRKVFLRVLRFSPLLKNQHFQIKIRSGTRGHV